MAVFFPLAPFLIQEGVQHPLRQGPPEEAALPGQLQGQVHGGGEAARPLLLGGGGKAVPDPLQPGSGERTSIRPGSPGADGTRSSRERFRPDQATAREDPRDPSRR